MFSTVMRSASERVRSASDRLRMQSTVMQIKIDAIESNPSQPRRTFDEAEMMSLATSIRQNGILQPLSVRRDEQGRYILIAGERRLRAARLAGLTRVPCVLMQVDERQAAVLALMENLQREDLSCFEEAEGIQRLIEMGGLTREEIALRLGKAQSTLANKLRLLQLHPWQRKRIEAAGLCERHARALLRLEPGRREEALNAIIAGQMTVGEADALVAKMLEPPPASPKRSPVFRDLRLFVNTINHAVDTMRRSGVNAKADKQESDRFIEYHIVIPKPVEAEPAPTARPTRRAQAADTAPKAFGQEVDAFRDAGAAEKAASQGAVGTPKPIHQPMEQQTGAPAADLTDPASDPTDDVHAAGTFEELLPPRAVQRAVSNTGRQADPAVHQTGAAADLAEGTSDEPEPTDWDGIGATEAVRPEMPSLFVINGGSLGGWDEAAPAPPKAEEPRQEPPRGGQGKSSLEALLRKVTGARAGDKGKKSRTVPDRRPAADSEQTVLDGFMEYTRRQG